jgi:Putative zinc- or iron-chelating domain
METHATPQALCLSCGLCCDGTLFGRVFLRAADVLVPLQAGGIEIQANDTKQYFEQPCTAYRQGCCQVYTGRPATCRTYRCELLKKYESEAISWAETQQRIGRVQTLKETLGTELGRIVPEGNRMSVIAVLTLVPTHEELAADPDLLKTWAPVMLRLSALLDCLRTHFQRPRQNNGLQENTA